MRPRNIRLLLPSEDEYLLFCSAKALGSRRLRDSLALSAAQKLSLELELVLNAWVATVIQTDDRRIVGYDLLQRNLNRYVPCFRELDSIALVGDQLVVLFEFKVSGNPNCINKAFQQLDETRKILCRTYNSLVQVVLWCDTSNGKVDSEHQIVDLDEARSKLASEMGSRLVVRLFSRDVWDWGHSQSLLEDRGLYSDVVEEVTQAALRKQERKQLLDAGVLPDDLPAKLKASRPILPESRIATFGETDSAEGTLAAMLSKALGRDQL